MVLKALLDQSGTADYWGDFIPKNSPISPSTETITCWLNQFAALKVNGPDAERFLQGQLTCNVNTMTPETVHFGACCNAKGRVVANFIISFDGENYWLILPTGSAQTLQVHLQKYKVFFKANIEFCEQSHVILGQWVNGLKNVAQHSDNGAQHALQITPQRRILITRNDDATDIPKSLTSTLAWRLDDMKDGIYYVENDQIEVWIPQHINWHHINGISFKKGCYTGQEIIARLQYLGKAKKALYHYQVVASNETLENERLNSPSHINQPMFNADGKSMGKIVFNRLNKDEDQLHVLAVLNTDKPDDILYLTNTQEISLKRTDLPPLAIESQP